MSYSQVSCKLREFLPTDAVTIRLRHWDALDLAGADLAHLGRYFAWAQDGSWRIARTLECGDGIVACAGVVPLPGTATGEAWMLTSDLIRSYPLALVRAVRMALAEATARGLTRVHTLILPGHIIGCRFLEALGFQREGLLRRCGHNGLDRYIYARITE